METQKNVFLDSPHNLDVYAKELKEIRYIFKVISTLCHWVTVTDLGPIAFNYPPELNRGKYYG